MIECLGDEVSVRIKSKNATRVRQLLSPERKLVTKHNQILIALPAGKRIANCTSIVTVPQGHLVS